jgi:hypothetical protein
MAKSNAQVYKVRIFDAGVTTLKGTIQSIVPGKVITYLYKKPRSSKYAVRTVAWKDLIGYSGEQGQEGTVTFKDPKAVIRIVKGMVNTDEKGDLVSIVTEDNENLYVKAEYMEAISEEEVEAPNFGTSKKKAKAKVEDEKPAKKKKAA